MDAVNINEARFKRALAEEMPGLSWSVDGTQDMLNLRFSIQVRSGIEMFVNEQQGFEHVMVLAERVRQEALVKTGANRIVEAANQQAEQYRLENVRLGRRLQDSDEEIKALKARIVDLQDTIGEDL